MRLDYQQLSLHRAILKGHGARMNTTEATIGMKNTGRGQSWVVASVGVALAGAIFVVAQLQGPKRASASLSSAVAMVRQTGSNGITSSFACGDLACDARGAYCETIKTDVPELPSNHACRPLPPGCMPRPDGARQDCTCFPKGTRGDYCSASSRNGVQAFYRTSVGGH